MTDFQQVPVVAGCVLERDGKYLLVQEKNPKVYGKWNLPAGHVDIGETIEAAAVREAHEETGFEVELGAQISVEHPSIERPVLHAFQARIVGGELTIPPEELLDAKWFTIEEIRRLEQNGELRNDWVSRTINLSRSI